MVSGNAWKCQAAQFSVNGREYRVPARPLVVICIDGCADEYLDVSLARGLMPNVARMAAEGYRGRVRGALPSFTNVNNAAIVTGVPPVRTGIGGNYFIDPRTGREVMMNSAEYLRAETILAAAARAGRKVAMVTAKDKLRDILSKGLAGIAFSAERADEATVGRNGVGDLRSLVGAAQPPIYSAEASLYVLRAGAALIERGLADFLYLSLTDYMQHKFAPQEPESLEFHAAMDREIGRLLQTGAAVAATADHGMNCKQAVSGGPNVIYLETLLNDRFGGAFTVICPITDPYVAHHGALGSAVAVYLPPAAHPPSEGPAPAHSAPACDAAAVGRWVLGLDGVTEAYDREMAVRKLEMPPECTGDLFVLAGRSTVIGRTPDHHDLSQLDGRLRSHGGRYEEMVPLLLSAPPTGAYAAKLALDPRNFDVFDIICNGVRDGNGGQA